MVGLVSIVATSFLILFELPYSKTDLLDASAVISSDIVTFSRYGNVSRSSMSQLHSMYVLNGLTRKHRQVMVTDLNAVWWVYKLMLL